MKIFKNYLITMSLSFFVGSSFVSAEMKGKIESNTCREECHAFIDHEGSCVLAIDSCVAEAFKNQGLEDTGLNECPEANQLKCEEHKLSQILFIAGYGVSKVSPFFTPSIDFSGESGRQLICTRVNSKKYQVLFATVDGDCFVVKMKEESLFLEYSSVEECHD